MNNDETSIHMVGIGGSGMNALALMLAARGDTVTGSDLSRGPFTDSLAHAGVKVTFGHSAENLGANVKCVIKSAAIPPDNAEIVEAEKRGVETLKYSEFIGRLMENRSGVAVAGTHGKTTCTAMTAHALIGMGEDPSVLVGGNALSIGGSFRHGKGPLLVVEACEYDRSFLNFSPAYGLITNVEADHLDYYSNLDELTGAFADFASNVRPEGALAVSADSPAALRAAKEAGCDVVTFGSKGAHLVYAFERVENGRMYYSVARKGSLPCEFSLPQPGRHNAANAAAVAAMLEAAGFDAFDALRALEDFPGVGRRFEKIAEKRGIRIYDDYAHHPTELAALLEGARSFFKDARLLAVFQPHQYSRTRLMLEDFARVLSQWNEVIIPPIYRARDSEEAVKSVKSQDLADLVNEEGGSARTAGSLEEAANLAASLAEEGDVIFTLGAGDVYRTAGMLASHIEEAT